MCYVPAIISITPYNTPLINDVVEQFFIFEKINFPKESTTHANEILHTTKKNTQHPSSLLSVLNSKECIFLNLHELLFYVLFEQKFASVKLKIDYRKIPALENKNVRSKKLKVKYKKKKIV